MFDTVDNPGYCHYTNCKQLAVVDGAGIGPCMSRLPDPDDKDKSDWLIMTRFQTAARFLGAVGGAAGPIKAATMALRPGIRSRVELPPAPVIDSDYNQHGIKHGSMNVHIPIIFEDGVRWMARIKMEDYWPKSLRRAVAEKEVATLQALHSVAPEFVPDAWMPPNINPSVDVRTADRNKTFENRSKLYNDVILPDMAAFYYKVVSLPFTGIGSVVRQPAVTNGGEGGEGVDSAAPLFTVGPLRGQVRPMYWSTSLGPFTTNQDAWVARIDLVLDLLDQGAIYPSNGHTMQSMFSFASDPIVTYLLHLEARKLVLGCEEMAKVEPTYICHDDDNGDHYIMADDGHIKGIIDWELAYTAPLAEMLATKYAGRDELELSATEMRLLELFTAAGRTDLADALKGCRKYHKLKAVVGRGSKFLDIDHIWSLRQAFLGDEAGDMPESLDVWVAAKKEELKDDPLLQKIQSRISESDAEAILKARNDAKKEMEARQKRKDAAEKAAKEKAEKEKEGNSAKDEAKKGAEDDKGEEKGGEGIKVGNEESNAKDKSDEGDKSDENGNKVEKTEKEEQEGVDGKEKRSEVEHEDVGTAGSDDQPAVSGTEFEAAAEAAVGSPHAP
ncbi:uncharacterized protein LOC62_04G006051 [Vanrija pseudolonga]|uniref:Aminoglycoside phosphotransferase domain-containing protein n=1 Tax=Vanrija pseudolonga TaxID=143232 RepID=A0AAF0YFH4_9TREE|nr:hypothetical protein LOC62_04G006051 [Vanrija pseudolonga]